MRHFSPILFTLLTTIAAAACDFDSSTLSHAMPDDSTCHVQLVAVQPVAPDVQPPLGQPDHFAWVSATATGCTSADLQTIRVDLYSTGDALRYFGEAEMLSYNSQCVIWAWPKSIDLSGEVDWLVLLSPTNAAGSVAGVVTSAMVESYAPPSSLPAYLDGDGWSLYLPGPSSPVYCQPAMVGW